MCLNGIAPHIVSLVGISQQPDTKKLLMIMTWCNGSDLRSRLHMIESYRDAFALVTDIALALTFFHSFELCHHDFHPGNILLKDSKALIADLGLSKPADDMNSGTITGVLPYIAPELLMCRKYTQAADIYSFGIIIWVILTRQLPFMDKNWRETQF